MLMYNNPKYRSWMSSSDLIISKGSETCHRKNPFHFNISSWQIIDITWPNRIILHIRKQDFRKVNDQPRVIYHIYRTILLSNYQTPHKNGKTYDSLQCDNLIVVTLLLVKEQLFIKLMYLHCRLQILLLPRNSTNLKRKNLMNSK